jgi:hypothetical protein
MSGALTAPGWCPRLNQHVAGPSGHVFDRFRSSAMASSTEGTAIRTGSTGRGFAAMDPERQREVPGSAIRTAEDWSPLRAPRTARMDWMRVQPDRDASMDEGSSSRRSR